MSDSSPALAAEAGTCTFGGAGLLIGSQPGATNKADNRMNDALNFMEGVL